LVGLKRFSQFLAQDYPGLEPSELSRQIAIDFIAYLQPRLKKRSIISTLSALNLFLTTCAIHGFAELPKRPLLYKEDFPKSLRPRPKFLPDEVHRQIVAQLDRLPAPYNTMLAILEQTGARVSEVLGLQIDCLSRDPAAGDYFIKRWLSKQKKLHTVPILPALAARIQAAAQKARQKHGPAVKYLFGNKNDRPLNRGTFDRVLTKWAIECDIRDNSGKLYVPHFHQFRHTVGTRMLNNGVSQYLVQRYLGHDSPDMTAVYAHLTDDTAKQAVADFLAQSDKQLKRLSEK
jgi:integrase/recombinase XerD